MNNSYKTYIYPYFKPDEIDYLINTVAYIPVSIKNEDGFEIGFVSVEDCTDRIFLNIYDKTGINIHYITDIIVDKSTESIFFLNNKKQKTTVLFEVGSTNQLKQSCECGAKYTSNKNYHLSFCPENYKN